MVKRGGMFRVLGLSGWSVRSHDRVFARLESADKYIEDVLRVGSF